MNRDQLPLEMRGKFGWNNAMLVQRALEVVAIALALRGPFEIKQARIPGGNLYALVAKLGGPVGHRVESVERRPIIDELCQEDRRTIDGLHDLRCLPSDFRFAMHLGSASQHDGAVRQLVQHHYFFATAGSGCPGCCALEGSI